MSMNPVVHFEIPAEDRNRMADFYGTVFGWQSKMLGPEMNEYVLVTTTENGENGMPKNPGTINGAFYKRTEGMPLQHISIVIQVDNIDEAIRKVHDSEGEMLGEPYDIQGVGKFVYIKDTEGNIVGMLQPV